MSEELKMPWHGPEFLSTLRQALDHLGDMVDSVAADEIYMYLCDEAKDCEKGGEQ